MCRTFIGHACSLLTVNWTVHHTWGVLFCLVLYQVYLSDIPSLVQHSSDFVSDTHWKFATLFASECQINFISYWRITQWSATQTLFILWPAIEKRRGSKMNIGWKPKHVRTLSRAAWKVHIIAIWKQDSQWPLRPPLPHLCHMEDPS